MHRLKEDDDGVDDDSYTEKAACAEPQDASPDFTFVKAVYAQVSEKEAEGIHRFYEGKIWTGVLWLCTGGLLGVGIVVDAIIILFKPVHY